MSRRGGSLGWTESAPLDIGHRSYGAQQPGHSTPAERSSLTRVIDPPYREKLPSSQDFNAQDFLMLLPAGVGSTIVSPGLLFTLPDTMVGWLQFFSMYVLTPTAALSVSFAIRINGGPVQGWANRQFPPGIANFALREFNDLRVRIPNGATIDVVVTNNSALAWTVGGELNGWYHPISDELRMYGDV